MEYRASLRGGARAKVGQRLLPFLVIKNINQQSLNFCSQSNTLRDSEAAGWAGGEGQEVRGRVRGAPGQPGLRVRQARGGAADHQRHEEGGDGQGNGPG